MKINDNKVVALSYVLDVEGAVRDRADAEHPLEFIFGMGYLLPKFEANVLDKEVGDKVDGNDGQREDDGPAFLVEKGLQTRRQEIEQDEGGNIPLAIQTICPETQCGVAEQVVDDTVVEDKETVESTYDVTCATMRAQVSR